MTSAMDWRFEYHPQFGLLVGKHSNGDEVSMNVITANQVNEAADIFGYGCAILLNGVEPDPRIATLESALRNTLELLAAVYDETNPIYSAVKKVANKALEGNS